VVGQFLFEASPTRATSDRFVQQPSAVGQVDDKTEGALAEPLQDGVRQC
jgi:hypothetical protein